MREDFPRTTEEREQREIHYYQWIPLLLTAQMIASLLPKLLYNSVNFNLGRLWGSGRKSIDLTFSDITQLVRCTRSFNRASDDTYYIRSDLEERQEWGAAIIRRAAGKRVCKANGKFREFFVLQGGSKCLHFLGF
jgi:hypothetical protein